MMSPCRRRLTLGRKYHCIATLLIAQVCIVSPRKLSFVGIVVVVVVVVVVGVGVSGAVVVVMGVSVTMVVGFVVSSAEVVGLFGPVVVTVTVGVVIGVGSALEVCRLLSIVAQKETEIRAKRKKSRITMFLLTMRFERNWRAQLRRGFLLSILITA